MGKKPSSAASTPSYESSAGKSDQEEAPLQQQRKQACLHRQLRKTKFCSYFLKGACQYGKDCAFAHTCAELEATPDLQKTRLCKSYAEGKCTDKDCLFAHGEQQLVSTGLFHKMSLCKWYDKGRCRNGNECRFAHGPAELRCAATNANAAAAAVGHAARGAASLAASLEPEPMKVLSAESLGRVEPTPPGQALAAPAAATSGSLPFMGNRHPKTPWPDVLAASPYAVHDNLSWQLRCEMQSATAPRSSKQSSLNSFVEMEQLRLSIASLSVQCAQMQNQLQHRQLMSPGLRGSSFGSSMCFPPDIMAVAQLAKFNEFEQGEKMAVRNALYACGLSKEALGA